MRGGASLLLLRRGGHQAASFRWVWVWLPGLPPHLAHVHTAGGRVGVGAVMRPSSSSRAWRGGFRSRPTEAGWWPSDGRMQGTDRRGRWSRRGDDRRPELCHDGGSWGRSRSCLRHVDEAAVVTLERGGDRRRGAAAVLGNDEVGFAGARRLAVVGVLAVQEDDHVGVLLDRPGFAEVGQE